MLKQQLAVAPVKIANIQCFVVLIGPHGWVYGCRFGLGPRTGCINHLRPKRILGDGTPSTSVSRAIERFFMPESSHHTELNNAGRVAVGPVSGKPDVFTEELRKRRGESTKKEREPKFAN